MSRFDHVVIGAGVMGSATARALARSGSRVMLLDQFGVGHKRGSSHGSARIFRFSYREAMYVEMAIEALGLWRDAESESGATLVRTTGGLDVGEGISENAAALERCRARYEFLDGPEAQRRFPALTLPNDEPVLFQPDSGVIAADDAVATFVASARAAGAEIREGVRVSALEQNGAVTVHAGDERIEAGCVVVTAGGWARDLLASAGIDLPVRPTRETVSYFNFDEEIPTLCDWGHPTVYALPSPGHGLKAGEHIAGPTTDPDEEGTINEESIERVVEWVRARFPGAEPKPSHSETCIYTNTEDEHFILERHGNIVVGSACSGHGFKFAPLIGKRLAALATET
ncbi:MAG: N-methyl-L-tryptophan oxidase [Actinomycetota bacterium]